MFRIPHPRAELGVRNDFNVLSYFHADLIVLKARQSASDGLDMAKCLAAIVSPSWTPATGPVKVTAGPGDGNPALAIMPLP